MRAPRILSRYVAREVLCFTALGLAALTPLLVSRHLIQLMDQLAGAELRLADLLALGRCLAAMLSAYALPIAFLLGVVLAVGRLASDREVAALCACGLGLRHLLAPVLALGLGVSALTAGLMLEVEHRAQRELRERVRELATHGSMIETGAFRRLGDRALFVRERAPDGELRGIFIADHSDPERPLQVAAERGRVSLEGGRVRLELRDGDLLLEGLEASRVAFDRFDYSVEAEALLGVDLARLRPREMPMAELRRILERARAGDPLLEYRKQNPAEYQLQIHRRIALPFAPALFALVGVPLGLRARGGARSWGALACAALLAGYYALLMFGQFLALEGGLPAALAMWAPNGAVAAAGCGLLFAARRPG